MDIARPDLKRRRNRNRIIFTIFGLGFTALVTMGLARLDPAMPKIDSAQVWSGVVERGEMIRQVRGNGSLVPEKIVTVQSDTGGTLEDVLVWPGAEVEPDTVILVLSNRKLVQETFDLEWQLKASDARLMELEAQLDTERFSQEATVTTLGFELKQALLEADASEKLFRESLEAELTSRAARSKADGIGIRHGLEQKRLKILERSSKARLAVQQAELEKLRASLQLNRQQVEALNVRAGIRGVLQQIGDGQRLQIGESIGAGARLAKVVRPDELKAEIRIAETQARDVQIGQLAEIDTRNGLIPGVVSRVDPAVDNGTVTVDITLEGELPRGARPDLSVDGTIQLERLDDVLHVGRPVHGQPESTIGLFKVVDGVGLRVPVQLGRSSVNRIEVREGLSEGDLIVLSDMSQYDEFDRIKID